MGLVPHRNLLPSEAPTLHRHILTLDAHNGQDGLGTSQNGQKRERERKSQPSCYRCGERGHRTCEKARGKTCSRCGKKNHFSKVCQGAPPPENVNGLEESHLH